MTVTYTPTTITVDELSEPVRYMMRRNGNIVVHLVDSNVDMELTPADEGHSEASEAARARKASNAKTAAANREAARADGSKWWIGQVLRGNGWRIVADADYDRIRVIFRRKPSEAQKEAVKAAGYVWSPTLKSWNRGLKCKAWRAAMALYGELKALDDPDAARRMQGNKLQRQIERGEAV